ncbi:hypothetical protein U1Q18_020811 [Sarracenia purpurea var. burkii]
MVSGRILVVGVKRSRPGEFRLSSSPEPLPGLLDACPLLPHRRTSVAGGHSYLPPHCYHCAASASAPTQSSPALLRCALLHRFTACSRPLRLHPLRQAPSTGQRNNGADRRLLPPFIVSAVRTLSSDAIGPPSVLGAPASLAASDRLSSLPPLQASSPLPPPQPLRRQRSPHRPSRLHSRAPPSRLHATAQCPAPSFSSVRRTSPLLARSKP